MRTEKAPSRSGSWIRKSRAQQGLSLIEIILGLVVLGVIIVAAFIVNREDTTASRVTDEQANIRMIAENAQRVYGALGTYEGISTPLAIEKKVVPKPMITGHSVTSRWGRNVTVSPAAVDGVENTGIKLTYEQTPNDICARLVHATADVAWDIEVAGESVLERTAAGAVRRGSVDQGRLIQYCSSSKAVPVVFTLGGGVSGVTGAVLPPVSLPPAATGPGNPGSVVWSNPSAPTPPTVLNPPSVPVNPVPVPPAPGPQPQPPAYVPSTPVSPSFPVVPPAPAVTDPTANRCQVPSPAQRLCRDAGAEACEDGSAGRETGANERDFECPAGQVWVGGPGVSKKQTQPKERFSYESASCPDPYGAVSWKSNGAFTDWASTSDWGPDLSSYCAKACVLPAGVDGAGNIVTKVAGNQVTRKQACPPGQEEGEIIEGSPSERTSTVHWSCPSASGDPVSSAAVLGAEVPTGAWTVLSNTCAEPIKIKSWTAVNPTAPREGPFRYQLELDRAPTSDVNFTVELYFDGGESVYTDVITVPAGQKGAVFGAPDIQPGKTPYNAVPPGSFDYVATIVASDKRVQGIPATALISVAGPVVPPPPAIEVDSWKPVDTSPDKNGPFQWTATLKWPTPHDVTFAVVMRAGNATDPNTAFGSFTVKAGESTGVYTAPGLPASWIAKIESGVSVNYTAILISAQPSQPMQVYGVPRDSTVTINGVNNSGNPTCEDSGDNGGDGLLQSAPWGWTNQMVGPNGWKSGGRDCEWSDTIHYFIVFKNGRPYGFKPAQESDDGITVFTQAQLDAGKYGSCEITWAYDTDTSGGGLNGQDDSGIGGGSGANSSACSGTCQPRTDKSEPVAGPVVERTIACPNGAPGQITQTSPSFVHSETDYTCPNPNGMPINQAPRWITTPTGVWTTTKNTCPVNNAGGGFTGGGGPGFQCVGGNRCQAIEMRRLDECGGFTNSPTCPTNEYWWADWMARGQAACYNQQGGTGLTMEYICH